MVKQLLRMCLPALLCAAGAHATTAYFSTPSGASTGGGAVDAFATLNLDSLTDTITITLQDLEANPTDVAQVLSDFDFVLSTGQKSGTLTSSSGQKISIAGDGSYTLGTTGSTGWGLNDNVGGGLQLDALGFVGPKDLLIGAPGGSTYSNANGSIAANNGHNPFLNQTATFVVDVPGITSATTVTSAVFSFGTTAGINVDGTPSVPEPATYLLLGGGLLGLGLFRKKLPRN